MLCMYPVASIDRRNQFTHTYIPTYNYILLNLQLRRLLLPSCFTPSTQVGLLRGKREWFCLVETRMDRRSGGMISDQG